MNVISQNSKITLTNAASSPPVRDQQRREQRERISAGRAVAAAAAQAGVARSGAAPRPSGAGTGPGRSHGSGAGRRRSGVQRRRQPLIQFAGVIRPARMSRNWAVTRVPVGVGYADAVVHQLSSVSG